MKKQTKNVWYTSLYGIYELTVSYINTEMYAIHNRVLIYKSPINMQKFIDDETIRIDEVYDSYESCVVEHINSLTLFTNIVSAYLRGIDR